MKATRHSGRKHAFSKTSNAKQPGVLKVADEVWIATALLHREHPDRDDFTVEEIIERARHEALTPELRAGVRVYVLLHCVANYEANPARYRVLYATGKNTRRLYRQSDTYHPTRRDSKFMPRRDQIPARYHSLLDWYESDYANKPRVHDFNNSILALSGLGKELWADEHADEYVRRLREDWD